MRTIRGTLTVIAFVVCWAISLVATVQTLRAHLPESVASNTTVLIEHLASTDPLPEAKLVRGDMARRVIRGLRADPDWPEELNSLDSAAKKRFANKLADLAVQSFADKVDRYAELRDERPRRRFVDQQLEEIMSWASIVERANTGSGNSILGLAAFAALESRANEWYRNANPEKRKDLEKFEQALRERFKVRMLNRPGQG